MPNIADRCYLEIMGKTVECTSIDEDPDYGKEQRLTMNKENRMKSHKHGTPKYNLKAELPYDLRLDLDFFDMAKNNTSFSSIIEYAGQDGTSRMITYTGCEVYKPSISTKDGESTLSLEIGALDRKVTKK